MAYRPAGCDGTQESLRPSAERSAACKQRPHLTQVVIHDRLATVKAQRLDQLTHPLPRQLGLLLQQPVDLVFERIQLRPRRRGWPPDEGDLGSSPGVGSRASLARRG